MDFIIETLAVFCEVEPELWIQYNNNCSLQNVNAFYWYAYSSQEGGRGVIRISLICSRRRRFDIFLDFSQFSYVNYNIYIICVYIVFICKISSVFYIRAAYDSLPIAVKHNCKKECFTWIPRLSIRFDLILYQRSKPLPDFH